MAKEFIRQFRDRRLTPEEIARDEEIRRKAREEFPPAHSDDEAMSGALSNLVRQAIRESNQSEEDIAAATGVAKVVISRFLTGERDIRMGTADKIAHVLGLRVGADG